MKKLISRNSIIALILTVYSAVVLTLFNPFELILEQSFLFQLIVSCGFIFILFLILVASMRLTNVGLTKKVIFNSAFVVAPIATGVITFFLFSEDQLHFLIYVSSFIVSSLLPVSLAILYAIFEEVKGKITISSEFVEQHSDASFLKLINDNGKVLLNVELSNIICFEANDNYVITYYLKSNGELEKSMERVSLKKIEEILSPLSDNFQRVHKSYIVNQTYVTQIQGKAQSYRLKLEGLTFMAPVSRNFDISVFQNV